MSQRHIITPIPIIYTPVPIGIQQFVPTIMTPCVMTPMHPVIISCPGAPIKIKKIRQGGIFLAPRVLF
jgi:hypothetical protein